MVEITFEEPEGSGQLQSIAFDAVVRDTHESSATVTEHPVETGANISDHVRDDLDSILLEAVVSNSPIGQPETQMDGAAGTVDQVELLDRADGKVIGKAQVLVFDGEFDRVRSVYEELRRLKSTGTVVGIITSLREYESMVIRLVSPSRTADDGNSLVLKVEATQVRIVESEIVDAPTPDENEQNRGRREADESDENTEERSESLLVQFGSLLGGI